MIEKMEGKSNMRISNKCSMAIHILLLLAVFPESRLTSEDIARSVGCNPVMIRNLLGKLKEAGLVITQRGTGGSSLVKAPEEISVWTVYQAVDKDSLDTLIGLHPHPYPQCPVGDKIYALLEKPYNNIKSAMQEAMEAATLKQLIGDYQALHKA
ncbi:Rrf2 family transcriptional regulator [Clostridia bacterium OttesenSCG-928-F22]|nr:Rrf2 family transcriptional regulator [Clostridia bacterium OttesenSCG-928-F22]